MLLISILIAATLTVSPILLSSSAFGQAKPPRLPDNSVVSPTIVDGQVLTQDLGSGVVGDKQLALGAVRSPQILDGTIDGQDLSEKLVGDLKKVTSAEIVDGTIAGQDLSEKLVGDLKEVTSAEIVDGTIATSDLAPKTIDDLQGQPGPTQSLNIGPAAGQDAPLPGKSTATCPSGTIAVSGGYQITQGKGHVIAEFFTGLGEGRTGWTVTAENDDSPNAGSFLAFANCASLSTPS